MVTEKAHCIKVLSFADEFREDCVFWRSQEKIGERIAQRRGDDEFRGGDSGPNGPEPGAERVPDPFGMSGTEVLDKTLGDDAGEDEDVVGPHLSLHIIPVLFRRSMQVLIAVFTSQRFHVAHPEVISEGSEDLGGLLEGVLDFEPKAVNADNLQGLQCGVGRQENALAPGRVDDQHKAYDSPHRAPQEVTHPVVDASTGFAVDGARCGLELGFGLKQRAQCHFFPIESRSTALVLVPLLVAGVGNGIGSATGDQMVACAQQAVDHFATGVVGIGDKVVALVQGEDAQ